MGKTVVAFSDSHGLHLQPSKLAIPQEGDLLICAGDIELRGEAQWKHFVSFMAQQPQPGKVVCFGNMDSWAEHAGPQDWEWAAQHGVTIAHETVVDVCGLRVYGSPATPEYYGVFQIKPEDAEAYWSQALPPDTCVDILVTHGPPYGYGDLTKGRHVGDKALLSAVQQLKQPPRLWICGHIHEGRGVYHVPHPQGGSILLVNAAVEHIHCGKPDLQPYIVDLDTLQVRVGPKPSSQPMQQEAIWKAPLGPFL